MPSTGYGYRYMAGTDPFASGATAIKNLAEDVQKIAGIGASGVVTITLTNVAGASKTVTFATDTVDGVAGVPRFTTAPAVVGSHRNSRYYFVNATSITNLGCTIWTKHYQNTATASYTCEVCWIAREGG